MPEGDEPPRLDADACVGCGLCVPACPAGAVTDVGPDAAAVVSAVAGSGPGDAVVRCHVAQQVAAPAHPAGVLVPCLAAIAPETLAAAAARLHSGSLTLERSTCEACPIASVQHVARVLRAGAGLAASVAPEVQVTDSLLERGRPSGPSRAAPRPLGRLRSRRSLFRPPSGESRPAPATPRALLLEAAPEAPLPRLEIRSGCTGCEACARVCPTAAVRWENVPGGSTAEFDPRACVDCGECARVCPEDVVEVTGRNSGPHDVVEVATLQRDRCSRCRAILAPGEEGLCSRCRGRRGMLDDVWAALA